MSYTLTIETTGDTLEVAEGQTILDACLRAGIWLPHACCHGLCADSDDRAHVFRSDAARRSDLIARRWII
ncbi:2Fe-2S iron-sulfur cluster-binding protein [Sphingomonas sp. SRS2]|uniref:2Fe-2S iron-sulfur cluster-binding protein n=1 Tax=Sphingomonas sp. SRS2 TaxID=133190 RepID=UPI00061844F4|nr:2Fe-2S iron-sulfur cluster binding domain-containing protein [Sphingomonas sp. SRS2]KKC24296.1 hypothetical protein WP12_19985 [Sphingomonas sp. SRS2]